MTAEVDVPCSAGVPTASRRASLTEKTWPSGIPFCAACPHVCQVRTGEGTLQGGVRK